jgi:hypothetical protein
VRTVRTVRSTQIGLRRRGVSGYVLMCADNGWILDTYLVFFACAVFSRGTRVSYLLDRRQLILWTLLPE